MYNYIYIYFYSILLLIIEAVYNVVNNISPSFLQISPIFFFFCNCRDRVIIIEVKKNIY